MKRVFSVFLVVLLLSNAVFSVHVSYAEDLNPGENGTEEPGDGTEEPGNGTEEPGDGTEEPGDGTEEPGDGTEEPGDGTEEPGDGTEEPGDGTEEPGDGTEELGDGTEEPGDGTEEPGDGTEEPGDGTEEPGDGTEEPGDGTEEPGDGTEEPGDGTEEPGDGTEEPGDGTEEPGDGTEEPGDGTEEPGDGTEEPGDGTEEPGDGTEEPGDGTEEPGDETEEPGDGTEEPGDGTEDPDPVVPSTPTGVSASVTEYTVTVSWSSVSDTESYEVKIDEDEYSTSSLSYKKTGLSPETEYSYRVRAVNGDEKSSYSSIKYVTTDPEPLYPPTRPTGVSASSTESTVTISWTKVTEADSYSIEFGEETYKTYTTANNEIKIENLTDDTTFKYKVKAINEDGSSEYSSVKNVTTVRTLIIPETPSGVGATNTTETKTVINWDSVSEATGYELIFDSKPYTLTTTSKEITGLTAGIAYLYKVRAVNDDGASSYSSSESVTTKLYPEAPTGLSAEVSETTANISWNIADNADSYELVFDGESYLVSSTSKSISDLTPGESYSYKVRSINADGNSEYSALKSATTQLLPSVPTGLSANVTETSAVVSWSNADAADSYELVFDGESYSVSSTSKTISDLTPGESYSYKVRSLNADGNSEYSTSKSTTTQLLPSTPTGASASATETTVTVSWDMVSNATGYELVFNSDNHTLTSTSKEITGLIAGTSYSYKVRAINSDGNSSYSSIKSITTKQYPKVPTGLSATVEETEAVISWSEAADADSYELLFDGESYSVSTTSKTISGLTPGKGYVYKVRSINTDGNSEYSSSKTITTQLLPVGPTNITASATETSVILEWEDGANATSYEVKFDGSIISTANNNKTFTGLTAGESYSYQIRSVNKDGESSYSSSKTVTTKNPPSKPSGISSSSTTTTVTLSWSAIPNTESYEIIFDGKEVSTSSTSYTFKELTQNTEYTYKMRGINIDGYSDYSAIKTAKTEEQIPDAPGGISTSVTETSIKVTWSDVARVTSYDVNIDGTIVSCSENSYTFINLIANTDYTVKIRAKNSGGSGEYSSIKSVSTLQYVTSTPDNVEASKTETSVTISWDSDSYATGYEIDFNGNVTKTGSTVYTFENLDPYESYTYKVRSTNRRGNSDYSSSKTIRTLQILPGVPSSLETESNAKDAVLSWGAVDRAVSYEIKVDNKTVSSTSNSIKVNNLRTDTEYSFAVRAVNQAGNGEYSSFYEFKTNDVPPKSPNNVEVSSSETTVTVNWTGVSNATSYEVYLNGTKYFTSNNSYTFTDLDPDSTYSITIKSKNGEGYSEDTEEFTIITDEATALVLNTPIKLNATATNNSITISWDSVQGASEYELRANGDTVTVKGLEYTFTNLESDTNYDYIVRAINSAGTSSFTKLNSIRTLQSIPGKITGISHLATQNQMTILWNELEAADEYEVVLNGKSYKTTSTTYTFKELSGGNEYSYKIRGINSYGAGDYSINYEAVTTEEIPQVPSSITGTATDNSITVKWQPVNGAKSYEVNIGGNVFSTEKTYFTAYKLSDNTEFTYTVRAKNRAGTSVYSDSQSISTEKTVDVIILVSPDVLEKNVIYANETFTFKWSEVADAASYSYVLSDSQRAEVFGEGVLPDNYFEIKTNEMTENDYNILINAYDNQGNVIGVRNSLVSFKKELSGVSPSSGEAFLNQDGNLKIGFDPLPYEDVNYLVKISDVLNEQVIFEKSITESDLIVEGHLFDDNLTNIRMVITAVQKDLVLAETITEFTLKGRGLYLRTPVILDTGETINALLNGELSLGFENTGEIQPTYYTLKVYKGGLLYHESTIVRPLEIRIPENVFDEEDTYIIELVAHKKDHESSKPNLKIVKVLGAKKVSPETGAYSFASNNSCNITGTVSVVSLDRLTEFGFMFGEDQLMNDKIELKSISKDGNVRYRKSDLLPGEKYYYQVYAKGLDGTVHYGQMMTFTVSNEKIEAPEILSVEYEAVEGENDLLKYTITTDMKTDSIVVINQNGARIQYTGTFIEFDNKKIWTVNRVYRTDGIHQEKIYASGLGTLSDPLIENILIGKQTTKPPSLTLEKDGYEFFVGSERLFNLDGEVTVREGIDKITRIKYVIENEDGDFTLLDETFDSNNIDLENNQLMISSSYKVFDEVGKYIVKIFVASERYQDMEQSYGEIVVSVKENVKLEGIQDEIQLFDEVNTVAISGTVKSMNGSEIEKVDIIVDSIRYNAYKPSLLSFGTTSIVEIEELFKMDIKENEAKLFDISVLLSDGTEYSYPVNIYRRNLEIEIPEDIQVGSQFKPRLYSYNSEGELIIVQKDVTLQSGDESIIKVSGSELGVIGVGETDLTISYYENGDTKRITKIVRVGDK